MKFFSEVTNKFYPSPEECERAEKEHEEKIAKAKREAEALAQTRKERAKEVEEAYRLVIEASNRYYELRNAFIKDYGSFHMTISKKNPIFSWFDLF